MHSRYTQIAHPHIHHRILLVLFPFPRAQPRYPHFTDKTLHPCPLRPPHSHSSLHLPSHLPGPSHPSAFASAADRPGNHPAPAFPRLDLVVESPSAHQAVHGWAVVGMD